MKQSHFFAHLARMKLIQRWPLMRSISSENISEHSLQVAFVAHALALIKNKKFDGQLNAEHIALLGMYHDTSEVLTGDLPTPVKYYNPDIAQEYKKIEAAAEQRLLSSVWRSARRRAQSQLAAAAQCPAAGSVPLPLQRNLEQGKTGQRIAARRVARQQQRQQP